jgi:hypothetical protein
VIFNFLTGSADSQPRLLLEEAWSLHFRQMLHLLRQYRDVETFLLDRVHVCYEVFVEAINIVEEDFRNVIVDALLSSIKKCKEWYTLKFYQPTVKNTKTG